jgi:hypothetical protein
MQTSFILKTLFSLQTLVANYETHKHKPYSPYFFNVS